MGVEFLVVFALIYNLALTPDHIASPGPAFLKGGITGDMRLHRKES